MDDQVTLTAYADQVRELIRNDRNDEAIAICKHILRYHPKYVDAYRQLGEAYLEKGRHADAKEMFRRVLSADPESVVAYAGLAVVLEQEHLVAEAAWHMERAFELAPSNPELHQELHRLYHELDGRPRARLELTPGALARQYVAEGLCAQAIQELNAIIAESAARFDARVALAETLWRIGQMRQAAEVAQALLESLPYCLKANLILGAVWKETGLSESEQYLQRAQALDPTNQTAQRLFGAHSPLPLTQARVPRYVEGAPVAEVSVSPEPAPAERPTEVPTEPTFEPAREPAVFAEPTFTPPVLDTTLPPWLRVPSPEIGEEQVAPAQPAEPVAETPVETVPVSPPAAAPQPEPVAETAGEVPAWLAQLRQSAEPAAETPVETVPVSPLAAAPQPEPAAETTGEVPAWLAQLRQSAEPAAEATTEAPAEPVEDTSALPPWMHAEAPSAETAPTIPSWVEEAKAAETTEPSLVPAEESKPEATPALPPWIAKTSRAEETAPAQPAETPREAELPPWLSQPAKPAEPAPITPTAAPVVAATPVAPAPAPVTPPAPKRKRPTRGDSHLVLARTHRDANQMKEALAEYDYIVQKAPRLVNQVIDDLELLSKRPDVPLEVHRILGDAYTRADRLGKALEEYRFVLGHVS